MNDHEHGYAENTWKEKHDVLSLQLREKSTSTDYIKAEINKAVDALFEKETRG